MLHTSTSLVKNMLHVATGISTNTIAKYIFFLLQDEVEDLYNEECRIDERIRFVRFEVTFPITDSYDLLN